MYMGGRRAITTIRVWEGGWVITKTKAHKVICSRGTNAVCIVTRDPTQCRNVYLRDFKYCNVMIAVNGAITDV